MLVSRKVCNIEALVWSWYQVGWRKFQYKRKRIFQRNISGRAELTYPTFPVPIGNAKHTGEIWYNIKAPLVAYHQNGSNSWYFSSLEYAFTDSG